MSRIADLMDWEKSDDEELIATKEEESKWETYCALAGYCKKEGNDSTATCTGIRARKINAEAEYYNGSK